MCTARVVLRFLVVAVLAADDDDFLFLDVSLLRLVPVESTLGRFLRLPLPV